MDHDHATVTTKLYEPTPILFVAPLNNVLGRVPLSPCFLTATPLLRYPTICAISKPALSSMGPLLQPLSLTAGGPGRGSNTYEVNVWLWQFGRRRAAQGASRGAFSD
jgi:hypothetical protein